MLEKSPLGKKSTYQDTYSPELLFPIPRKQKRTEMGIGDPLPFTGVDIWNAYELSWLNPKGKPEIAMAEFHFPCTSPNIIESKSFKLYLNSLNQTKFENAKHLQKVLENDLSKASGASVKAILKFSDDVCFMQMPSGICVDKLDISTDCYHPDKNLLKTSSGTNEEQIYSHLLKSNCLVTGQPDWGGIWIHYLGPKIDHESFLKYIISFRNHNEFHEQCVERIFMDLLTQCQPKKLTVYGRYTRRGGLDINPFRTNFDALPDNNPWFRQ